MTTELTTATTSTELATVAATIAPPTTALSIPAATTVPSTTIATATTTAPATSAPIDPADAAKAAVASRYEAFSVAGNECVAAASECDLPNVLGEFANPEAALYQLYFNRWETSVENNEHSEQLDRIMRTVVSVQVDGETAVLTACVADGSVVLDADSSVVDDAIGYRREETIWRQQDNNWQLIGGTTFRLDEQGDAVCTFQS